MVRCGGNSKKSVNLCREKMRKCGEMRIGQERRGTGLTLPKHSLFALLQLQLREHNWYNCKNCGEGYLKVYSGQRQCCVVLAAANLVVQKWVESWNYYED